MAPIGKAPGAGTVSRAQGISGRVRNSVMRPIGKFMLRRRGVNMRRINSAIVRGATIASLVLAGCAHETAVVRVSDWENPTWSTPSQAEPGIPFFVKKGVCRQESIWLEPQYDLSVDISVDGAKPVSRKVTLSRTGFESQQATSLLRLLKSLQTQTGTPQSNLTPETCPSAISDDIDALDVSGFKPTCRPEGGDKLDAQPCAKDLMFAANTAQPAYIVDYAHRYYLNSRSPWIGSSQVAAKLADDGTLTDGTVQRDDKTWDTILSSLSGIAQSVLGTASAAAAAPAPPVANGILDDRRRGPGKPPKHKPAPPSVCPAHGAWPTPLKEVKYTFEVATTVYKHDHTKDFDLSGSCDAPNGGLTTGNFNFAVTKVDPGSGKKSDKAIQFSGQVTLPDKPDDKKKQP